MELMTAIEKATYSQACLSTDRQDVETSTVLLSRAIKLVTSPYGALV